MTRPATYFASLERCILLTFACSLALLAFACGGGEDSASSAAAGASAAQPSTPPARRPLSPEITQRLGELEREIADLDEQTLALRKGFIDQVNDIDRTSKQLYQQVTDLRASLVGAPAQAPPPAVTPAPLQTKASSAAAAPPAAAAAPVADVLADAKSDKGSNPFFKLVLLGLIVIAIVSIFGIFFGRWGYAEDAEDDYLDLDDEPTDYGRVATSDGDDPPGGSPAETQGRASASPLYFKPDDTEETGDEACDEDADEGEGDPKKIV